MSKPSNSRPTEPGPFRADQLSEGSRYELSRGHPIYCESTGGRGGGANVYGAQALSTDPAVEQAGIDVGYTPEGQTLRAPDIAVGNVPDAPGWVTGVPPLAVEYADTGQDEMALRTKIDELLSAGTRYLWVVRLSGPRRVEVHEPDKPVRIAVPGEELTAPDVLRNPVPVMALYDRNAAHRVTLRNLLQREGYESLDAVREQGREQGLRQGLLALYRVRFGEVPFRVRAIIEATTDASVLTGWFGDFGTQSADQIVSALAAFVEKR